MRIGVVVATLVFVAGCNGPYNLGPDALSSSDGVGMEPKKREKLVAAPPAGKYRDFREQFIAERPSDWPEPWAACLADQMIPKLDPVVLGRMNAAARGDYQMTASEYEQIDRIVRIRLEHDRDEMRAACGG